MRKIFILPSFERSLKRLSSYDKKQIATALEEFNSFVISGHLPTGLKFKKINHDKYEFRVDIRLRIIIKAKGKDFYLVLVGTHDDVRRHLRRFR